MQKILIGVNTECHSANENFIKLLITALGYDEEYWVNYLMSGYEDVRSTGSWDFTDIRTNATLHQLVKEMNFIIGKEYGFDVELKIVEIPDEVQWHIETYECGIGEYVCENYRTWK